jgi:hypothetical protein
MVSFEWSLQIGFLHCVQIRSATALQKKHWPNCVLELEELLAVELSRDSGFLLPTSFWSFLPFPLIFFAKLFGFVISLSFVCETLSEEDMTLRLTYACWETHAVEPSTEKRRRRQRRQRCIGDGNDMARQRTHEAEWDPTQVRLSF